MNIHKAVFLDRDGVITEDPPHYAHRIDQLSIIPKSGDAIRLLNDNNFLVIVISNQSGVARGYYEEKDIKIFNDEMERLLKKENACIDSIYYCPHHPNAVVERYRIECECRKPKPGMIHQAIQKNSIDIRKSFVVGDKWSDINAGRSAGCKTVLVLTGHGNEERSNKQVSADYIATDLFDAVTHFILTQS